MKLAYEPLLALQRDFYHTPRGLERFQEYLRLMTGGEDLVLPLAGMSPMGQDDQMAVLDALLAIDADGVAARATAEAQAALADEPGAYQVMVVVGDDRLGGETNRYASDMAVRFRQKPNYTRGWIVTSLWTSETYTAERVREEVWAAILRAAYVQRHGYARTLHEMLRQEGCALKGAGVTAPALAPDDLAYTRAVLETYRDHSDEPTLIPALFGDRAAYELGYPPLGLSEGAGLAVALAEGQRL
jgi:hypothetical protein